ncbi:hypothetical protein D3C76_1687210 [compost metagenome]
MPFSAANLSILDAPKNPSMPSVLSITYAASSGSAIGPPWQMTIMSGFTALPALIIASIFSTQSSNVRAVLAPMVPFVVNPIWATKISAPASAMALACSGSNT